MNDIMKEIVKLSNNPFIQSNWTVKEGDFVFDGWKIIVLAVNKQFSKRNEDSLDIYVAPDADESYVWSKDFRTVQFKSFNYTLMTVAGPIWLPIGFDVDKGEPQIDVLLKNKLGIPKDNFSYYKQFHEWQLWNGKIENNVMIRKLSWLKELTK